MKKVLLTAILAIALVLTMAFAVSAIDAPDMTDFEPEGTSGGMQWGFNVDGWVIVQPDPEAYAPNKVNFEDANWMTFVKECAPDINQIYIAYTEGAANFESVMGRVGQELINYLDVVIWDARLFNNNGQYFGGSSLAGYQFCMGLTTFGPAGTPEGTCDISKCAKWATASDAYWVKWAFANNEFTKVILPENENFTEIFRGMFQNGKKLERFDIPSNVKAIKGVAFKGCTALTAIVVPASVSEIADDAFLECSSDLVFYTPAGSAAETFAKAKGFQVVNGTPEGGEIVDPTPTETTPPTEDTTEKEEDVPAPELPEGVVAEGVFSGNLCNIKWTFYEDGTLVHESNMAEGEYNQFGYRNDDWDAANSDYHDCLMQAKKVVVKEGISKVGSRAFQDCPNLEVAEFPAKLKEFCQGMFYNCPKFKTFYIAGNEPVEGVVDLTWVEVLEGSDKAFFSNCLIEKIDFTGAKVKIIPDELAVDCAYLTQVIFEDVTKMDPDVFKGCYNLQALVGYPGSPVEDYAKANDLQFGTPGTEFDIKEPVITDSQETTAGPEDDETTAKQEDTTAKQEESTAPQDAPQTGDVNMAMVIAFALAALGSAVVLTRKRRFN